MSDPILPLPTDHHESHHRWWSGRRRLLRSIVAVTFRNGHWILGILGFFLPVFRLIGAVLPPTEKALAAAVLEE